MSEEVVIGVPVRYELSQNYLNPFNPVTYIEYVIPEMEFATLKVYDISGKEIQHTKFSFHSNFISGKKGM